MSTSSSNPGRVVFRMGKRLYLRPMLREDAKLFLPWVNDPETTQFVTLNMPMQLHEEENWVESISKRKPHEIVLAIVLKKGDELIGSMGLHRIDFINGTASTGSIIGNKKHWGKGYGTEAKMLLLDYAFNTLNLRKIYSSVIAYNERSKRCMEKCGYHAEGVRKLQVFRNGAYHDEILTAIFKKDFEKLTKKK